MYFAVCKFIFDDDTATGQDDKQIKSLVTSLRTRFRVAAANASSTTEGSACVAVAALGPTEDQLKKLIDEIAQACEESGFGRIEAEEILLDHIDTIGEGYSIDEEEN